MPRDAWLDNIRRVSRLPWDQLFADHLATSTPVVLTDLYEGQPILDLDSPARARERIGDIPVKAASSYLRSVGSNVVYRPMALAEYLDQFADTDMVITEIPCPEAVCRLFDLPSYADHRVPGSEASRYMFLAPGGEATELHFDGDACCVFLTQVFGYKRVIIIGPDQTQKLQPYGPTFNLSGILLGRFPEHARKDFVRYTHAWETVLAPGETVCIPPLHWHYIEYLDFGFGFNVRFPLNREMLTLSALLFSSSKPETRLVQALGPAFVDAERTPAEHRAALERIAGLDRDDPERSAALAALHRQICPDQFLTPWTQHELAQVPDIEDAAVDITLRPGDLVRLTPNTRILVPVTASDTALAVATGGQIVVELVPGDEEWATVVPALRVLAGGEAHRLHALAAAAGCAANQLLEAFEVLWRTGCVELASPDEQGEDSTHRSNGLISYGDQGAVAGKSPDKKS